MRSGVIALLLVTAPAGAAAQAPGGFRFGSYQFGQTLAQSGIAATSCESVSGLIGVGQLPGLIVLPASMSPGMTHQALARNSVQCQVPGSMLYFSRDTLFAVISAVTAREAAMTNHWRDSLAGFYGQPVASDTVPDEGRAPYIPYNVHRCVYGGAIRVHRYQPGPGKAVVFIHGCAARNLGYPIALVYAVDSMLALELGIRPEARIGFANPFHAGDEAVVGAPRRSNYGPCRSLRIVRPSYRDDAALPGQLPLALLPVRAPRTGQMGLPLWTPEVRARAEATVRCQTGAPAGSAWLSRDTVYAAMKGYPLAVDDDATVTAFRDTLALLYGPPDSTVNATGRWYVAPASARCRSGLANTVSYHSNGTGRLVTVLIACTNVLVRNQPTEAVQLAAYVTWYDLTRSP